MGRVGVWLLLASACADHPTRQQVSCSQLVLKPGSGAGGELGVAAGALPAVAIDLSDLAGIDHLTLSLRTCGGARVASLPHAGGGSFLVDPDWYAKNAPALCHRLVAIAVAPDGTPVGADWARVRQGDFSLSGDVLDGKTPVKARVRVEFDALVLETDSGADGRFTFDHVPAGTLWRASAREPAIGKTPRLAQIFPRALLDAGTPSLVLHLSASPAPHPVDAFEPDDDLGVTRAPLAAGMSEQHSLPDKKDVDYIPLAAAAGQRYRATVTGADVALQMVDAGGNLLAHANDTPDDFSPSPSLTVSAGGPLFLRVSRNDDESAPARYQVTWARVGVGP
jgi:hypothetical protein